jgi:arginase
MNVHIIGVPLDMGTRRHGTDMGPNTIRYAALETRLSLDEQLRQLGYTIIDEGNLHVPPPENGAVNDYASFRPQDEVQQGSIPLRNLGPILDVCERLATVVERASGPDDFPMVLGGDHSIALGSITGVVKARGPIGILWIDAHGDFNTTQTSPTGNIHGMPLAALAGLGDERLVWLGGFSPKVSPAHIAIVGARDLDIGERELLRQNQVHVFTMKDIDLRGLPATIAEALAITTNGTNGVHVSFDMDVIDPLEAPGVGTRVAGGMTYREAHLAMELIADSGKLTSLDIAEVNPMLDQENRTAKLAVELILSALGKRIF